ncbi:helix-turn-helix DNA binding protein [Gordonia phage Bibwit]|uniref:Helix-turn-helix DNA binding protein n=1 Tax=Gordonia phage Bibwit TaxID=2483666 RepID=A0A3G3M926_9CAUD|nr:Rnase E [Gordonia phage Bibwit]AYR02554.1 helix-turn-helix DNA binding protein [Gordonia phage Bibwit]
MPPGTSKRVDAANDLRRLKMLDMWLCGHTYQQIADEMELSSHATVYRQIQRELKQRAQERADLADQALEMQLARIERLLQTHMKIGTDESNPLAAARSARVALDAIDRLNRLLGLDQPQRHEHVVTTVDAVDVEIARLTALLTGHAEERGIDVSDLPALTAIAAQVDGP